MRRREVVIVGGGFCGSILAKKLDRIDHLDTVLIDENGYFEYYPSLPKLLTDPEYKSKIRIKLDSFLHNTKVIESEAIEITADHVKTTKNTLDFDYLVISKGAEYPILLDNTENVFTLTNIANAVSLNKKIERSKSVLIIGGGLIGVEAASELAVNTDKDIVLVHTYERLVERNSKTTSKYAEEFLRKRNVQLIFDDEVTKNEEFFHTKKGKKIRADVAIWAGGLKFDESLFDGFNDEVFSDDWGLEVDSYLRLKGHENIFVGGDITSIEEEKTGHNADRHGRLIYRNILNHTKGKKLKRYRNMEFPLVISLGRENAIFASGSNTITGSFPSLIKHLLERVAIERLRF